MLTASSCMGSSPLKPSKPPRPIELEYKKVGPGRWVKWNPILMLWSILEAERDSNGKLVRWHSKHVQPKEVTDAIIDFNVAQQNAWKGNFGSDVITQTSRLPIPIHRQIMEQCGYQPGHGYDEVKFKKILNDRDYYKLKTVPGRL